MAQGPFILNLAWESQYFRTVFILTRMENGAVHEVQLAVEGEEDLLCLTHLANPSFFSWKHGSLDKISPWHLAILDNILSQS